MTVFTLFREGVVDTNDQVVSFEDRLIPFLLQNCEPDFFYRVYLQDRLNKKLGFVRLKVNVNGKIVSTSQLDRKTGILNKQNLEFSEWYYYRLCSQIEADIKLVKAICSSDNVKKVKVFKEIDSVCYSLLINHGKEVEFF